MSDRSSRFSTWRDRVADTRVLVAGDVMLDRYWFGDVDRISPEAPVPIAKIVTQLNMDMIGRNKDNKASESNTVYPVGSDRISSELHKILIDANAGLPTPLTFNYQLNEPTDPERVYYRSDHYSYAAKGIPIVFFTTFLHPDYHRVTDSVEKIEFAKLAHIAQLVYETGRRIANLDHDPVRDFKGPHLAVGSAAN